MARLVKWGSTNDSIQLKRVQLKFSNYTSFILGFQCHTRDYILDIKFVDLVSLASRLGYIEHEISNRSLLSNAIGSPAAVLSLINFNVRNYPHTYHIFPNRIIQKQLHKRRKRRLITTNEDSIPSGLKFFFCQFIS